MYSSASFGKGGSVKGSLIGVKKLIFVDIESTKSLSKKKSTYPWKDSNNLKNSLHLSRVSFRGLSRPL